MQKVDKKEEADTSIRFFLSYKKSTIGVLETEFFFDFFFRFLLGFFSSDIDDFIR